ncbi:MAG TPA: Gfo/Idh/MocA family oxidoreductase [Agriterribacter sp.]|nr:Gfo/Idh/MocA family oxidoreductase [Agriterribacter sp.]
MAQLFDRRRFLKTSAGATIGAALIPSAGMALKKQYPPKGKRIGIIGLDTSHTAIFSKAFNAADADPRLGGYKVVAACSRGSRDIASALANVPSVTEDMHKLNIPVVDTIEALLPKVDVVLLETNDGRVHLEQAIPVLKSKKPLFIDKPVAASLADALAIYEMASRYQTPVFSSSALRFMANAQEVAKGKVGKVNGADTYSPATIEKTHPDLYWYGIHGIEILFTVMGTGCKSVSRMYTPDTDLVAGEWEDQRIGTFRGLRNAGKGRGFGGTVFGEEGIATVGPFDGYENLLAQIANFFTTGIPPVSAAETLEICAFIEAADESKAKGGAPVYIKDVMRKAEKMR